MKYGFFTSNEIRPNGWTERQLRLQAQGLAGQLDRVWPDVRDSMWIGGEREGWERVPYWLDGFIPLAYLLDDDDMKQRAKRYVDCIIANQEADGWICPNGSTPREKYDTWAVQLISKVLVNYAECSNDERIPDVVYRIMKNYYELLKNGKISLFSWAKRRWFESFIALNWLYVNYKEEWIKDLAKILREQGTSYEKHMDAWALPLNKWTQETHVVNLAMMLKSEAVSCELLGEEYTGLADKLYGELMKYNAMPTGMFTGDECLSGISAIQGVELCAVVELMFSLERLYAYTGDKKWAQLLEKVSFNALPAAVTDDMWAHQYVQMSNQIDCTPFLGNPVFRTNGRDAHVFGLEPHFGCCTANFGQGWPKLVLSTFMRANDGVVCAMPVPAELNSEWNGIKIKIRLDTEYPFKNTFKYTVEADKKTAMKLHIRVPSFAKGLNVNGKLVKKQDMLTFCGFNEGKTEILISFDVQARLATSPSRSLRYVEYGSLVFSLPIKAEVNLKEYTKNDVERKFPYCDYHYKGVSEWNFAYSSKEFTVEEHSVGDIPFSSKSPALVIKAKVTPIDWGYAEGYDTVCAKLPRSRKAIGEAREAELYPYGCAKLRMTEMPYIQGKK